jgi:hypothetical protein
MENHAVPQTEFVYVPASPAGASAQMYRSGTLPVTGVALIGAALTVTLLDDPERARFTFECVVETRADAAQSGVEFASAEWAYDIPAQDGEISGPHAWDATGTLETELQPPESKASRLRVRFRRLVRHSEPYRFWFAYEAPVRAVVSSRLLTRMVVCTGWMIFNLPCDSIRICIQLPGRARLLKSVPAGDVTEPEPGAARIRYHLEHLRALETSQWLVAYERRKIGLPLYLWSASQLAAAFVGWLIGRALDGWAGRG